MHTSNPRPRPRPRRRQTPFVQGKLKWLPMKSLLRGFTVGEKGKDNGVLLLLAIDDHRSKLEVGGGVGDVLPDGLDGMLLVEMRPALRAGQYGQAMLEAAQTIGSTVAKSKGVEIKEA